MVWLKEHHAAARFYHPHHLANRARRIGQVLENPFRPTGRETGVRKLQLMGVADREFDRAAEFTRSFARLGDHCGAGIDADDLAPRSHQQSQLTAILSQAAAHVQNSVAWM